MKHAGGTYGSHANTRSRAARVRRSRRRTRAPRKPAPSRRISRRLVLQQGPLGLEQPLEVVEQEAVTLADRVDETGEQRLQRGSALRGTQKLLDTARREPNFELLAREFRIVDEGPTHFGAVEEAFLVK